MALEDLRFSSPWEANEYAIQALMDHEPGRAMLLVMSRRQALEIQNDALRRNLTQGFLGETVLPVRDYLASLFKKAFQEKLLLPRDVSVRLVERAREKCSLETLDAILNEPGGLNDIAQALEAFSAIDPELHKHLPDRARNRDLKLLYRAWMDLIDHYGFVPRTAVQRHVIEALLARRIQEDRALFVLLPAEQEESLRPFLSALGHHTDVRVCDLASSNSDGLPAGTLLTRFQTCPSDPVSEAFAGAAIEGSVSLMACPGEDDEARRIVERIKQELVAGRWKPEEIAIVVRRPDSALSSLRAASEDCGVPLDFLESVPPLATPLIPVLLAPLTFASQGYERDTFARFFTAPFLEPVLSSVSPAWDPGRLAQFLQSQGIGSSRKTTPADWNRYLDRALEGLREKQQRLMRAGELDETEVERLRAEAGREIEFLQEHRRVLGVLFEWLAAIPREGTAGEFRAALLSLEKQLKIGEFLAANYNKPGYREDPGLLQRGFMARYAYLRALDALEARSRMIDEEARIITADEARNRLETLLGERALPSGRRLEGAVAVLRPEEVRAGGYRVLFLMGLLQAQYPHPSHRPPLIDERIQIALHGSREEHLAQETRLFRRLVLSARETLVLSYPHTGNDGKRLLRSVFVDGLLAALEGAGLDLNNDRLFHSWPVRARIRPFWDCYGSQSLLDSICAELRGSPGHAAPGQDPARRAILGKTILGACNLWRKDSGRNVRFMQIARLAAIEAERDSRRRPGLHDGALEEASSLAVFFRHHVTGEPLSASRINTYAHCPAQYFYRHVLGIEPVEEPEFGLDASEKGSLVHELMYDFLSQAKCLRFPLDDSNLDEARRLLESAAERLFRPERWPEKPRLLLMLEFNAIRRFFDAILNRETEREGFAPRWLEHSFDDLSLAFEGFEQPLRFRGRIDRVDFNNQKPGEFVLIDYKSGSSAPGRKDIENGIEFQIPLYVRAVSQSRGAGCRMAFYYKLLSEDGIKEKDCYQDDAEGSYWSETVQPRLARLLQRMVSGHFTPRPQPDRICDYCDFSRICRYRAARFKRKEAVSEEEGSVES